MSRAQRERAMRTARTRPCARMLATSALRSADVIVSGFFDTFTRRLQRRNGPPSVAFYAIAGRRARDERGTPVPSTVAASSRAERRSLRARRGREHLITPALLGRETPRDFGVPALPLRPRASWPVIAAGSGETPAAGVVESEPPRIPCGKAKTPPRSLGGVP
jgi:hypothetical protein